jgi:hypothetical protein
VAAAIAASFPQIAKGRTRGNARLPEEVYATPLFNLSHNNFNGQVGTLFTFEHPTKGNVSLRLVEVADLKPLYGKHRPSDKESFALTFIGPMNQKFHQGTYKVTDSKLGPFELFIVPSNEKSPRGRLYEANINRLYP